MATETTQDGGVAAWAQALDRMEAELSETLTCIRTPDAVPAQPAADAAAKVLAAVEERMAKLQECMEHTASRTRQAEEQLADATAAVEGWQQALAAAGRKLAEAVARAV